MKARRYASTTRHSGSAKLERERYRDPKGTGDSFIYLHHDGGVSDQTFFLSSWATAKLGDTAFLGKCSFEAPVRVRYHFCPAIGLQRSLGQPATQKKGGDWIERRSGG